MEMNGPTQGDAARAVLHSMMMEGVVADDPGALEIFRERVDAYQSMMEVP